MTDSSDAGSSDDDSSGSTDLGPASPSAPTPSKPTVPTPDTPDPTDHELSSPADKYENIDSALLAGFWKVVLLLKLSLIGFTIGSLLAAFGADYLLGGLLMGGALVLFSYTVREVRLLKTRADAGEFDHELVDEATDDGDRTSATAEGTD